jgi:hypothetical protein
MASPLTRHWVRLEVRKETYRVFMRHFHKKHSEQAIKVIGATRGFGVPAYSYFIPRISSQILIKFGIFAYNKAH